MKQLTRLACCLALVLGVMLGGATFAHATTVSFNLASDHCSGGCGPAGTIFGTVTLNDNNGPNVTVTVHLNNPYAFAKTGSVDFQAFLFSGVGVALGDITVAAHTPVLVATAGPYTASNIGTFQFGIGCPSCANGLSDAFTNDIVFTVANATIADLTQPLAGTNHVFAADIGNLQTGATGPIDADTGGPPQNTPEPTTLTLLGVATLGLGAMLRRKISR
jgi:PEP-CTERM motif-containing protein